MTWLDFDLVFTDECPDARFSWRLMVEVGELLERHGFTATEIDDPDLTMLELDLHEYVFGRACRGYHR